MGVLRKKVEAAGLHFGGSVTVPLQLSLQGARHAGLEMAFQNVANPTALLLSATAMLRHLG